MLSHPQSLENEIWKVILESKMREDKVQVMNPSSSVTFTNDPPPYYITSKIPMLKDAYMLTVYQIVMPSDLVMDFILSIWKQNDLVSQIKSICALPQLPDRVFIECQSVEIFLPFLRHFVYELVQPHVFLSNFVNTNLYKHAQRHDLCRITAYPYTNEPAQVLDLNFIERKALIRCWPILMEPNFNATQRRSYPFDIETIEEGSSAFEEIPIILKFDGSEYNPNGFIFRGNKYLDEFIILKVNISNLHFDCDFSQYEIDRFIQNIQSLPVEKTEEQYAEDENLFISFANSIRRILGQSVSESASDYIKTKLRSREEFTIAKTIQLRSFKERHGIVGRPKLRYGSKSTKVEDMDEPELMIEGYYSTSEDENNKNKRHRKHRHNKHSKGHHQRSHSHSHSHKERNESDYDSDSDSDLSSKHKYKKHHHHRHHKRSKKQKRPSYEIPSSSSSDETTTDGEFRQKSNKKIGRPSNDDIAERRRQEIAQRKKEREYAEANIIVEPKKKIPKRIIKPKKPPQVKDLWFPTPGHPQPLFTDPNPLKETKPEEPKTDNPEEKPENNELENEIPKLKLAEESDSDITENVPTGLIENFPDRTKIIGVAIPESERPVFRAGKPITRVPLIVESREDDPPFLTKSGTIPEFSQEPIDRPAIDGDLVQIDGGEIGIISGSKLHNLANEDLIVNQFHAMPLQSDNSCRDIEGNRILPGDRITYHEKEYKAIYTIHHRVYIRQKYNGLFVRDQELQSA